MSTTVAIELPTGQWVEVMSLSVGILTNNTEFTLYMAFGAAAPTDPQVKGHIVEPKSNERIRLDTGEKLYVFSGARTVTVDVVEWS